MLPGASASRAPTIVLSRGAVGERGRELLPVRDDVGNVTDPTLSQTQAVTQQAPPSIEGTLSQSESTKYLIPAAPWH